MGGGPRRGSGVRVSGARRVASVSIVAATTLAAAALCLGAVACGVNGGTSGQSAQAAQARTLELARADFARAADALRAGDRAAFIGWLSAGPAVPATARRDLGAVFDTLSPLPWRTFSFAVTPLDPAAGLYRVRGTGQLGTAGPPDRIAVLRYLRLRAAAGGVSVLADRTPDDLRRRYLMALHDPVVLQRPGLVVLADRWARTRAETVLAAAARARSRLSVLGVGTRPTVVVTVFGSAEDELDALGIASPSSRLVFFAYPALRVADALWPTYDVGVMGPWLRDAGARVDPVLRHELAHAYTVRWFAGDAHPPALLVEGIAEAAEGSPAPSLREEVATGDQLWPLPESFATTDVWDGNDDQAVSLGYQVGGSLVEYVLRRWGARSLRPFVQAVAAAAPTEAGMDEALGHTLGVSWREFYAGWRRYVLAGR
jgi:hypothetical protein